MTEPALVRYRGRVYDSARWAGFELRSDDIIISTPPKCGTTWTQMICAVLVLQSPELDRPLAVLSPWFDMVTRARLEVVADLEAQRHRRIIKTHTPLDGLPHRDGVTYICVGRDPRDVALSMDNHLSNMDLQAFLAARERGARIDGISPEPFPASPDDAAPVDLRERFWRWVDDDTPPTEVSSSLRRTLHHLETFWMVRDDPHVVLLHFDDLKADLEGSMRALATRLGIEVPAPLWPELVAAATFDQMRAKAAKTVPRTPEGSLWQDDGRFFHRGTSGQWRELLDDDDQERYRERVRGLVGSDLAAWMHPTDPTWTGRPDARATARE